MPIGDFDPFARPCCPARTERITIPALSIQEQMGTDPISKLAAAIHDLADAMRETLKSQESSST